MSSPKCRPRNSFGRGICIALHPIKPRFELFATEPGRVIFRVENVDAHYGALQAQGLMLESPRDAAWGERFFHVTDLDGHELSFAELLPVGH